MILGYKKSIDGAAPYWFGKQNGEDLKFVRVVAGVALPLQDRMSGAIIVLGEIYRSVMPMTLVGLAAEVGRWITVENAIARFRKDLKFQDVVVDNEHSRNYLLKMKGIEYGQDEYPIMPHIMEPFSESEVGHRYVDQLVKERRLDLGSLKSTLDKEPDQGILALSMVCSHMRDWPARYTSLRVPQRGAILGVEGL